MKGVDVWTVLLIGWAALWVFHGLRTVGARVLDALGLRRVAEGVEVGVLHLLDLAFSVGVWLFSLYGLVRFVKWAWS